MVSTEDRILKAERMAARINRELGQPTSRPRGDGRADERRLSARPVDAPASLRSSTLEHRDNSLGIRRQDRPPTLGKTVSVGVCQPVEVDQYLPIGPYH